jgi:hypothetical protein
MKTREEMRNGEKKQVESACACEGGAVADSYALTGVLIGAIIVKQF